MRWNTLPTGFPGGICDVGAAFRVVCQTLPGGTLSWLSPLGCHQHALHLPHHSCCGVCVVVLSIPSFLRRRRGALVPPQGWQLGRAWLPLLRLLELLGSPSSPGGCPCGVPIPGSVWMWHLGTWISEWLDPMISNLNNAVIFHA